ncbi:MAG: hypothetical protein V1644_02225 [Candidatus Micrarchaeota archaeon]
MRELKKQLEKLPAVKESLFNQTQELLETGVKPPTLSFDHNSRLTRKEIETAATQAGFTTQKVGKTIRCTHTRHGKLQITIAPHERRDTAIVVHHLDNVENLTDGERKRIIELVNALPVNKSKIGGVLARIKRILRLN